MIDQGASPDEVKRIERGKLDALLGVCETTACRRQAILAHFGETLAAPCGNCDTCLSPAETWDATTAARKALSAILRTGQRFGVGHLTDLLLGVNTEKMVQFRHDQLPTFGVGKELDRKGWGSIFRQLAVRGAIETDHEAFGALRITAIAEPILRGQQQMLFRLDKPARPAAKAPKKPGRTALYPGASPLFEALRAQRARLAREQGVPAYVIFHDSTLIAIATARPTTLASLGEIPGMGRTKIERYGAVVLTAIAADST
jgi:ATP-dependent DNA helicase RecQ